MEIKLKRRLDFNEVVDHNDGNQQNDHYSNLVIRDRSIHSSLDVTRSNYGEAKCAWCGSILKLSRHQAKDGWCKDKAGPFCSKSCIGSYGKYVQTEDYHWKRKKLPRVIKYTLKNL